MRTNEEMVERMEGRERRRRGMSVVGTILRDQLPRQAMRTSHVQEEDDKFPGIR